MTPLQNNESHFGSAINTRPKCTATRQRDLERFYLRSPASPASPASLASKTALLQSLADAKPAEDAVEEIIGLHGPGHLPKFRKRGAQIRGEPLIVLGLLGTVLGLTQCCQRRGETATTAGSARRHDLAGLLTQRAGDFLPQFR